MIGPMEAQPGEETKNPGTKGSTVIWKKKNPRGAERPTPELDRERWKTEIENQTG